MASTQHMSPPYASKVAAIGGLPTIGTDVPITAVFLALFLGGAVSNMTILQLNLRKGHKFLMSGLMFGFCMARILTCTMRIVWATRPTNLRVAMTATILVAAGVLILFIINLIFAQRILRAAHPHFGWHKALSRTFIVLYVMIIVLLAMLITAVVQSFYTLNTNTRRIDADLERFGATYFLTLAFLPIPLVIIGLLVPRKTRVEKFGTGRWRSKICILLTTSTLLCLGSAFRTGTSFKNPRPINDPAWYDAKWCFYFFNFTMEVLVIYLYILLRIDRRFHVPNGSKAPGDYSREGTDKAGEKSNGDNEDGRTSSGSKGRILSEEEVFDNEEPQSRPVSKDEAAV